MYICVFQIKKEFILFVYLTNTDPHTHTAVIMIFKFIYEYVGDGIKVWTLCFTR
jgi:hypothetical protein